MSRYKKYCLECKSEIVDISKSFIVDEERPQTFCSENCIINAFKHEMDHFEKQEKNLRVELQLFEQLSIDRVNLDNFTQQNSRDPDETWMDVNELGEKYYYLIKSFPYLDKSIFNILICKMFNERPSLILHSCYSTELNFVNFYKIGKKLKGNSSEDSTYQKDQFVLPQEIIDEIEVKKNEYFALLLEFRKDRDIPFESFPLYEKFIQLTLDQADQVWSEEQMGQEIRTFFKVNFMEDKSFYYFVIGLKVDQGKDEVILPIFSFPTNDKELGQYFLNGKQISRGVVN